MKKNIAVLFGGASSEHEVSCMSAVNVINGLDASKYTIHRIGITKERKWLYVKNTKDIQDGSWYESTQNAILTPDGTIKGLVVLDQGKYEVIPVDVVFPVLHGFYGEDGTVQGMMELSGVPYVGCGVLSSAVSMDKISTKIFVDRLGIRQAKYVVDIERDMSLVEQTMDEVEEKLGYPVFVKPSNAGSSCGVSRAANRQELKESIRLAKMHDRRVLIEEEILGREIECAVLGGSVPKPSVVGEILAAAEFYDYDAKYNSEESRTVVDPELKDETKNQIRQDACKIFKAVSGFGLARVDFFVENKTGEVVFNELNTLPGFTNISMYPTLWNAMGVGITELLDRLIQMAYER